MLVHGTCVELFGLGVLLRGPSGCGKSDLALRLIDDGARLVADDQVVLTEEAGRRGANAQTERMPIGGNHIADDRACPVRSIFGGEGPACRSLREAE